MILLRALQMTMYYDSFYIRKCQIFAEELCIPNIYDDNKSILITKISETLSTGSLFHSQTLPYLLSRKNFSRNIIENILYSAQKLGILTSGKSLIDIITEIQSISNIKWDI
jgi:hypothetical protein